MSDPTDKIAKIRRLIPFDELKQIMFAQLEQAHPELDAKARMEIRDLIGRFDFTQARERIVRLWAEFVTEADVNAAFAYFESPWGVRYQQAAREVQPLVTRVLQEWAEEQIAKLQKE